MLSRVANAIYWMSRYIERAENIARFIDVNHHLMLDRAAGTHEQWLPLVSATGDQEFFLEHYAKPNRQNVIDFLTYDMAYPHSIVSCVAMARENARTIRDTIAEEMWEQINAMHIMLCTARDERRYRTDTYNFYKTIKQASQLFNGITITTMSHSMGWEFNRLGKLIERADKTSRIVDVKYFLLLPRPEDVGGTVDTIQWTALLRSTSALEMYRQTYGAITPTHVTEFLVLNPDFPRSLAYCLSRASESLGAIAGSNPHIEAAESMRLIGRLKSELEFATIDEIVGKGIHEYLDQFQGKLNTIDNMINLAFFQIAPPEPSPDEAHADLASESNSQTSVGSNGQAETDSLLQSQTQVQTNPVQ